MNILRIPWVLQAYGRLSEGFKDSLWAHILFAYMLHIQNVCIYVTWMMQCISLGISLSSVRYSNGFLTKLYVFCTNIELVLEKFSGVPKRS